MEENEGLEVAAESSESSESQSDAAVESQSTEQTAQAAAPKQEQETPFHEHPRFKELVEQKNKALENTRALELKLAQLEGRFQAAPSPQQQAAKDELIEDLKKIDPRLASRLEAFGNSSKTIEQLQAKLDQFEKAQAQQSQQQVVQQSVAKINTWHDSNKVPAPIRDAINAQLDVQYMSGKLNPQNLEAAYKAAYEPYKAFLEETKREALKQYVPDKKKDAATPTSQPKGQPASKPKAPEQKFKSREEARQAAVQEFLKNRAAQKEASS